MSLEIEGANFIPVSLTFDDGNKIQYNRFYPIMREFKINATFYIVTSQISKPGKMTWDELKDLYEKGNEIGSHTHTHRILTNLSDLELDFELKKSKSLLKLFRCETLAYPFGAHNHKVIDYTQRYYIAARGYYDLTTKSRDYGYNYGLANEVYKLKVFPTEHSFPSQNIPLLDLPIPKLKKALEETIRNGVEKKAWIIFVFHGPSTLSFNDVINNGYKQIHVKIKSITHITNLLNIGKTLISTHTRYYRELTKKFRWMCEYLASNDQVRIFTLSKVINMQNRAHVC